MPTDWPIATNPQQYLRQLDRRLTAQERRAAATSAADLVGPGIAARAIQVYDWNDETTTFNGFFYSTPGALNAPETGFEWNGNVVARADGSGTQTLTNPQGTAQFLQYSRTFKQHPLDPTVRVFGPWKQFLTATGTIGEPQLDETIVTDINTALEEAAAAIEFALSSSHVYYQDTMPTEGEVGWIWFDTNDSNRLYVHNGSTYADPGALMVNATIRAPVNAGTGTSPNVVPGIALGPAGLALYDTTGTSVFLNAVDGSAVFKGAVTSGSTVTGAIITGGTIQTDSLSNVGIKLSASGLVAWSGGVPTFVLDGATGNVTLQGSVIAGGSMVGTTFMTGLAGENRVYISDEGQVAYIRFFYGYAVETLGQTGGMAAINDANPRVQISSGTYTPTPSTQWTSTADILLHPTNTGLGRIVLRGTVETTGSITVTGGLSTTSAIAVGTTLGVTGAINGQGNITVNSGGTVATFNQLVLTGIGTGGSANVHCNASGLFFKIASTRRVKTHIEDLDFDTDMLRALRPRQFNRTDGFYNPDYLDAGFIAEEVHEIGMTQWVEYDEAGDPNSVAYSNLCVPLHKGWMEHDDRLLALERENLTLTGRIEALDARLAQAGI